MKTLKPPRITQAALKAALARRKPIRAARVPGTLREAKARDDGSEFVKYTRGKIVFKAVARWSSRRPVLALYIPPGATVYRGMIRGWGGSGRKCRTERVYVIGRVYGEEVRHTRKRYYGPYRQSGPGYKSGKWVEADGFDTRFTECAKGIHFFETSQEARNI